MIGKNVISTDSYIYTTFVQKRAQAIATSVTKIAM